MNESEEDMKGDFPMGCRPTQHPFCLGDEMLPYQHPVFEYAKLNKMMNEVEKHLVKYVPEYEASCPRPQCKAVAPHTGFQESYGDDPQNLFVCIDYSYLCDQSIVSCLVAPTLCFPLVCSP